MRLLIIEDSIDLLRPLTAGLRRSGSEVDEAADRVLGLRTGDDCVVKPFAFDELLDRIEALLRRGRDLTDRRLQVARPELQVRLARRRADRAHAA